MNHLAFFEVVHQATALGAVYDAQLGAAQQGFNRVGKRYGVLCGNQQPVDLLPGNQERRS